MLLAYDTEKRLQKKGLARAFTLEQWNVEATRAFFDDTAAGAEKGSRRRRPRPPSDPRSHTPAEPYTRDKR
jgi:hypothetical protein